jgi:hypothetical protein
MVEAVARAADVPLADVRRAAMMRGAVGPVAQAALASGANGLATFRLVVGQPVQPMLASPAADLADALARVSPAALEWKLDGIRVQVHRDGEDVAIFTRSLDEITERLPEIVEQVLALPVRTIVLDGEAIALYDDGRPRPFQQTGSRTSSRVDVAKARASAPVSPYFFDVLRLDDEELLSLPGSERFAALSSVVPDPLRASFQPLPMFTNNIWDAPTLMRVIATGNNLFYIVLTQRPHLERNFSAHAQSMQSLIEMDFWSVRTIVEDGHHFWRSYFRYDGDYRVYPISIPIYQDAVLADGYIRTLKAQFVQLRRWTYGASDVAYIASKGFYSNSRAPRLDVIAKFLRTLEGHVTWATGTLLIYFAAFIPPFINPQSFAANELPLIVSRVQRVGIIGLVASLYVCLLTLPPRPARYRRHRSVLMLVQWVFLPVTSIVYGSSAAFYSQTRLMLGKYMSKFDVTEKAVVDVAGNLSSSEADPTK